MVQLPQKLNKVIQVDDILNANTINLRLVTRADCNPTYLGWLNNPVINRYLETRWSEQGMESIRNFVESMLEDPNNYLFAIIERATHAHIGNIKLGPINQYHLYADVSYFIGDPFSWGKGYATEAIKLVSKFAFERLKLHRLQAGFYASNVGSKCALEKANFKFEAIFKNQLRLENGWEDHCWYVLENPEDSANVGYK